MYSTAEAFRQAERLRQIGCRFARYYSPDLTIKGRGRCYEFEVRKIWDLRVTVDSSGNLALLLTERRAGQHCFLISFPKQRLELTHKNADLLQNLICAIYGHNIRCIDTAEVREIPDALEYPQIYEVLGPSPCTGRDIWMKLRLHLYLFIADPLYWL